MQYVFTVIRSFRDKATAMVFAGSVPRGMTPDPAATAYRKLAALNAAEPLEGLSLPPGNRSEALRGDRRGSHSIRVNGQWRIVFEWQEDGAYAVEIVDYH